MRLILAEKCLETIKKDLEKAIENKDLVAAEVISEDIISLCQVIEIHVNNAKAETKTIEINKAA